MDSKRYFLGNSVESSRANTFLFYALIVSFIALSLLRFAYPVSYAGTWDAVDFALALERFDLLQMQPHFPGYPYFIVGGMIVNKVVGDAVVSLSIFNAIIMTSSAIPMYLIAMRVLSPPLGVLTVLFVHSSSYLLVLTNQPMSEGAALGALWWYMWSLVAYKNERRIRYRMVPLLLFSVVLGIRLSYLPFGIGLLLLWVNDWRKEESVSVKRINLVSQVVLAILFQLIWIIGLMVTEGSPSAFIQLAIGFVSGHFSDWGGAATAADVPMMDRVFRLISDNLMWTGLFARSPLVSALFAVLTASLIIQKLLNRNKTRGTREALFLLVILGITYLFWALFAQNIEKPRHIAPLISIFSFSMILIYLNLFRSKAAVLFISFFIVIQTLHGVELLQQQSKAEPATYQLAKAITEMKEPLVVYTWEEKRIMDYLEVPYRYKRILTYDYFARELPYLGKQRILLTDKVVKGFLDQGVPVEDKIKKIARFQSNSLFDPVYHDIILYEWIGE